MVGIFSLLGGSAPDDPVCAYFDRKAKSVNSQMAAGHNGVANTHSLSQLYYDAIQNTDLAKTDAGRRVLDVCIGTGASSQLFLNNGFEVHGVDGSPKMLKHAEKNGFDKERLKLVDVAKDGLPFPDGSFPITISAMSLISIRNAVSVMKEMLRVTEPNGAVIIDMYTHAKNKKGTLESSVGQAGNELPIFIRSEVNLRVALRQAGAAKSDLLQSSKSKYDIKDGPQIVAKRNVFLLRKAA